MIQLILASASKGREYLLRQLKIPFDIMHTDLDEENITGKSPIETVNLRAKLKGEEVASGFQRSSPKSLKGKNVLILTADTEVVLDGKLTGKPRDYSDAVRILKMLSGKTHEVVSAVYLLKLPKSLKSPKKLIYSGYDSSLVTFHKLTNEDIKLYLSLTEYTRYTGGYALIASPQTFISRIAGSISNVIGLPLEKIIPILKKNNLL